MTSITLNSQKINKVAGANVSFILHRLRRVPALTENDCGFLNVADKVFTRARSGDLDARMSAMLVAGKVRELAKIYQPGRQRRSPRGAARG